QTRDETHLSWPLRQGRRDVRLLRHRHDGIRGTNFVVGSLAEGNRYWGRATIPREALRDGSARRGNRRVRLLARRGAISTTQHAADEVQSAQPRTGERPVGGRSS